MRKGLRWRARTRVQRNVNESGRIPLALFTFNVGVEIGQLIFIAAVLGALRCARLIKFPELVERHARSVASYAIGSMAAYWFIERLAGFAV
jgi:hypothetical protein